jgi:hypothetical protein
MQTSDGPYQYTIGTMARVARFKGADQDGEQTIQRSGQRPQRIRAWTGAATSGLGNRRSLVRPGRQPHQTLAAIPWPWYVSKVTRRFCRRCLMPTRRNVGLRWPGGQASPTVTPTETRYGWPA